jgi:DNA-directed RNA polymerase subunit M/transcription elongation factor TFIIS
MTHLCKHLDTVNSVLKNQHESKDILDALFASSEIDSVSCGEIESDEKKSNLVYEFIGSVIEYMSLNAGISEVGAAKNVLADQAFGWNNHKFNSIRTKMSERDDFILKPFDVEDGTLTCKKCGSKKVFSYSKQIRSSDEPASVFAQCIECKSKWIS